MVGLIPKILIEWLERTYGDDKVVEVATAVKSRREEMTFNINEVYDDVLVTGLFAATCSALSIDREEFYRLYANAFMSDVLRRFPMWRKLAPNARSFLERQPRIHNGFATAVQDPSQRAAINDKFRLETHTDEIITHYRSPNKLCGLYRALAEWVLNHYGETAEVFETRCMHEDDPECSIHVRWSQGKRGG